MYVQRYICTYHHTLQAKIDYILYSTCISQPKAQNIDVHICIQQVYNMSKVNIRIHKPIGEPRSCIEY